MYSHGVPQRSGERLQVIQELLLSESLMQDIVKASAMAWTASYDNMSLGVLALTLAPWGHAIGFGWVLYIYVNLERTFLSWETEKQNIVLGFSTLLAGTNGRSGTSLVPQLSLH